MKSIIIYDSYTGNTKKIAEAIAKELKCRSKNIKDIKPDDIKKSELIVVGTPVHGGMPSKKIKKFLEEKKIAKSYALFCTYGVWWVGKSLANNCLNYMKKKINAKCIGKFKCPGHHQIFKIYKGRPNQKDLENAIKFAQSIK